MPNSDRDPTIDLRDQARITVVREPSREHIDISNEVLVRTVRRLTPEVDQELGVFIEDRQTGEEPTAVTPWLADQLRVRYGFDPERHGVEEVDPSDPDIEVVETKALTDQSRHRSLRGREEQRHGLGRIRDLG